MRILIDLTSLDDNFTGMEHYALLLSKELIKNKEFHFHLVFKNKVSYFSEEELKAENISYQVLTGGRMKMLLWILPKYINKYKPDYALFLAFPPSLLWKPKKGTKVISTVFDMVPFDIPKTMTFKSRVYFRKSIRHLAKISDDILTDSQFSKDRFLFYNKKYNPDHVHVSYCASGMKVVNKDFKTLQEKYKLPNKYLLSLSTLEPRKNFASLIKWLDHAWDEKKTDLDLVVAGRKGWKVEELLSGIKNIDKIHFAGFVDDEDISSLYENSTCFIFPSIYEGFGMPILESILSGKLPLCSSIDVFKEILGNDYPFYFDCHNEEEFKSRLVEYLSYPNDKKAEIYNEISAKVSVFDWKKSAEIARGLLR